MARTETVTVLFTDLVGSTELASRLGHDAYESLRQAHFVTLRAALAAHHGADSTAALAETEPLDMSAETAKLPRWRERLAHHGT